MLNKENLSLLHFTCSSSYAMKYEHYYPVIPFFCYCLNVYLIQCFVKIRESRDHPIDLFTQ